MTTAMTRCAVRWRPRAAGRRFVPSTAAPSAPGPSPPLDRRFAGSDAERLDDDCGQDRQPGPGHQDRAEVVATDVGVDVRRGEEAGDDHGGAVSSA